MSKHFSQHKIDYIGFLRTKQEYDFVKEDWADESFLRESNKKDHKIFEDE